MLKGRERHTPGYLAVLCERRIGRPVTAAAQIRVRTPAGTRTHALALTNGILWWIELRPWRSQLGAIIAFRALDDMVIHSARRRRRAHLLELSFPATGELLIGTVSGHGADKLLGLLASEQFTRAYTNSLAPQEER